MSRVLYTTKSGYEVKEYDYFEWRNRVKDKPKAGVILSKSKSKEK